MGVAGVSQRIAALNSNIPVSELGESRPSFDTHVDDDVVVDEDVEGGA